MGKDVILI